MMSKEERSDNMPSVGVVITVYDEGEWLREAVNSVPAEFRGADHLVVVNDGSEDKDTLHHLSIVKDHGIRVLDQSNGGVSKARNTGWNALNTEVVLFLDADNRIGREYLLDGGAVFKDDSVGVVYADRVEFGDRSGIVKQPSVAFSQLLVGNRIDACALVRRSILEQLGGFDESMRNGYEDWEFWIRVFTAGHRFVHIPRPLFEYRVRPDSLMQEVLDPEKRRKTVSYVLEKHHDSIIPHWKDVITDLHAIQVHDYNRINELRGLIHQNEARFTEAEQKAEARVSSLIQEGESLKREKETLLEQLESQELRITQLESAVAELEEGKNLAVEQAHKLQTELHNVAEALQIHRVHSDSLQRLVAHYEARIKDFESSKYWRLKRAYFKMVALLRTSSASSSKGFKWLKRGVFLVSQKGRVIVRRFLAKVFRALYLMTEVRQVRILVGDEQIHTAVHVPGDRYHEWMSKNLPRASDLRDMKRHSESFQYTPMVSVLMPVYNPPIDLLEKAIRSVQDQVYQNWELCIADDCSPNKEVVEKLREISKNDDRVKVEFRKENGHISKASNSALSLVSGDYIAFMDHDDLLSPDALYQVVLELNRDSTTDIFYSDEDKVNEVGQHSDPHFKPEWCPDHLLSRNYFGHLVVIRTSLVMDIGGFREGFEGSQDYDLVLRATERTDRIVRIPKVLYHWRIHDESSAKGEDVKPYAYQAGKRSLTEALSRRGEPGTVEFLDGFRGYRINFENGGDKKVSVIIPTKDKADILKTCLDSIFELTDHPNYEIIVISNGSSETALFELLKQMKEKHRGSFSWYELDKPFNFSELMNYGVERSSGEQLVFLNNDTEIIDPAWMTTMCKWSARKSIGAVGVKLLYHNDTIQHAGVIIGLGGVAGHTFVGYPRYGPGYFNYVNTVNNYSAVTAACMMVERRKFDQVGGFDEEFTVEYNDVDLCLKLQASGYRNVYVPDVELYHYESLSRGHPHMTKESYERHLREVALFRGKWQHVVDADPCYNPNLQLGVHDFQFAN